MEEELIKKKNQNIQAVNKPVKSKNNKGFVILLIIFIVMLFAVLGYLILDNSKKERNDNNDNNIEEKSDNNDNVVLELEKVNGKILELLTPGKTLDEFKKQAKNYFTDNVINELVKYYDKDLEAICIDSTTCGVGGGFFLEITDINYRKLEIKSIQNDIIIVNGIYGEDKSNITGKSEITYQKFNGIWKVSKYDIPINNTQEPLNNEENNSSTTEKNIYKSRDNKETLKIVDKNDKQAKIDVRNIWLKEYKEECKNNNDYFMNNEDISCSTLDKNIDKYLEKNYFNFLGNNSYFGYYNNTIVTLEETEEDDNYLVINGDNIDSDVQCHMWYFLINKKTGIIEKYNDGYYGFIKTPKGYYFTITSCEGEDIPDVYTSNWKNLGGLLSSKADNDGNIYAIKDNYVIKYDIKGTELKKSDKYKTIGSALLVNNVLYYIAENDDYVFQLVNFETNEKTEIDSHKKVIESLMEKNEDFKTSINDSGMSINEYLTPDFSNIKLEGNTIVINLFSDENKYTYDLNTKKLEKVN